LGNWDFGLGIADWGFFRWRVNPRSAIPIPQSAIPIPQSEIPIPQFFISVLSFLHFFPSYIKN